MQFVTVREFRANTAKFWRKLRKERRLIITRHGKPAAILTAADNHGIEATLRQEAKEALERGWREAERDGTAKMSMEEIDAEIAAARRARRR